MYRVLMNNSTLICASNVTDLTLIDPVVTLEANKAGTFTFTVPPVHPEYAAIEIGTDIIDVYRDDETEPLFEGRISDIKTDFFNQKKVTCEGELAFFNDTLQRPHKYQGMTARALLEEYVARHNEMVNDSNRQFTVGMVSVSDPNGYISCFTNYNSTMKEIKEDLVDDLGGYLRTRHENGVRLLDYLADSPRHNTQTIRLGMNLMDLSRHFDVSKIATCVIPLGADLGSETTQGLHDRLTIKSAPADSQHPQYADYVFSATAVNHYGRIEKTVQFDNVTTVDALLRKGKQYLQDYQFENLVIEAKAFDLGLTDSEFQKFKLLDMIRVTSPPHGLDREFMLTKMKINLNKPENDSITLGKTEKISMSAQSTQISAQMKKVEESTVTDARMDNAIDNATALITGSEGGYVVIERNSEGQPVEIKIQNTLENPTKIWRWNQNGFGYSNDGGQTYGLAMTMDGAIVADFITAGILNGITINGVNINGTNINGSVITSSGSVKRYASQYSQSDLDRINSILNGQTTPTDADYEKLDLNCNGSIDSQDAVICYNMIRGTTTYKEYDTSISISGNDNKEVIKMNGTALGTGFVRSTNGNFGNLTVQTNLKVIDGTSERYGYSGTIGGVKFVNGIAVGTS